MMQELECRLCSATTSLISLFSGKNRKNRDIIRKLALEAVNIQFEEGDQHSCICYNCVVHIYNIYIFQVRSKENEERLQNTRQDCERLNNHKHNITPLKGIARPTINILKESFTIWLQEKLSIISECSFEREINPPTEADKTKNVGVCQTGETNFTESLNVDSPTAFKENYKDVLNMQDMSCQTELKMDDKLFQSYFVNSNNSHIMIKKENKCTQCCFPQKFDNRPCAQGECYEVNCKMQNFVKYLIKILPSECLENIPFDGDKVDDVYHGLEENMLKFLHGTKSKFLAGIGLVSKKADQKAVAIEKYNWHLNHGEIKTNFQNKSIQCNICRDQSGKPKNESSRRTSRSDNLDVEKHSFRSKHTIDVMKQDISDDIKNYCQKVSSLLSNSSKFSKSVRFARTNSACDFKVTSKQDATEHKKCQEKNLDKKVQIKQNVMFNCNEKLSKSLKVNIVRLDNGKLNDYVRKSEKIRKEISEEPSEKRKKIVD